MASDTFEHQLKAGQVSNACTHVQSYHPGSGSYRYLLHPWYDSMAWPQGKGKTRNCYVSYPLLRRHVQSILLSASSTQHLWELLAGNRKAGLPWHALGGGLASFS